MAGMQAGSDNPTEPLTEREQEILSCLVDGLTNGEIASRLHLALRTVKWYNSQIYGKLGVSSRAEAIEQAAALGLLGASTDLSAPEARHNLPTQTTPFIGRQRELADLARLLTDPGIKLVTILAPGGMGKTRLGLAAAEQQLQRFADGVFFVPLAPLTSPTDLVPTIAENVGFSFYGSQPPKQQLLDYLSERRTLLVLDNFEHLLDGASLVADTLQMAATVKVLATSREKLNLSGETVYTLSGLEFPTWETPEDALEYDAVKLFMQSAHHVRPDFVLLPDNLDYLARICRLTAGMPLALVLAARWLDMLSLEQIAAEIQRGIDILETKMRDVPERQRSVRASFDYSWGRLDTVEQGIFTNLSVFRGGFTAEAAQRVAGASLRHLRQLVDQALVQALPDGRYEVHELLRQYGAEKLGQTDQAEAVQQAHSAFYMAFMAERDEDIKGRRQQAGLREIREDFENVRQAWQWAAEHRQYDAIRRALDCLVNTAEMNFSALDAQAILEQTVSALQPAAGEPPHPVWDQAVVRRERVNYLLSDPIDHDLVATILLRDRERGDQHEMAYCLWLLGDYADLIADYPARLAFYEECLALRQSVGDPFYIAHTFVGISGAYAIERSMECVRESARLRRATGDLSNLCFSLTGLGASLFDISAFAEAEAQLDEALAIQTHIGKAPVFIGIVGVKAEMAFLRGELDRAARLIQSGQDFAGARDYIGVKTFSLALLSWIMSVRGDYPHGDALSQQAASRRRITAFEFPTQWGLALAQCGLGNVGAARRSLRAALYAARTLTFQRLCLPIAAILAAWALRPERAAELLGLADAAPQALTGWMEHWQLLTDLRRSLETQLGVEGYAAAWESGSRLDLGQVIGALRAEFTDSDITEARRNL